MYARLLASCSIGEEINENDMSVILIIFVHIVSLGVPGDGISSNTMSVIRLLKENQRFIQPTILRPRILST